MRYATMFLATMMGATMMVAMPACAQPASSPQAQPPEPAKPPMQPAQPPVLLAPKLVEIDPNLAFKAQPDAGVWMFNDPMSMRETMEKGSYLGAAVSDVPGVLRDQLKLRKNVGLVVDFVEPGSPAEAGGLQKSDIIEKLDDQLIVTGKQFAILVRMQEAGKEVKLSIIREAKPMQLTAKLVERELATLDATASAQFDRLVKTNRFPMAVNSMLNAFGLESNDGEHSLSISNANGKKHLVAKDKSGKVIFEGDVETPEQVAKVPESIRPKVKALLDRQRVLPTTRPLSLPRVMPRVPMKGEDASRV